MFDNFRELLSDFLIRLARRIRKNHYALKIGKTVHCSIHDDETIYEFKWRTSLLLNMEHRTQYGKPLFMTSQEYAEYIYGQISQDLKKFKTEYVDKNAKPDVIRLNDEEWEKFISLLQNPEEPTPALKKIMREYLDPQGE